MNKIKVIKTAEDYKNALIMVKELMSRDPDPESEDGEKLDLLATLIEVYESGVFPESLPDPIDAIKFRMEQASLKASDLVPYIGSRSRVSEILSGKRKLTPEMMRSLQTGLGIPAKVLLNRPDDEQGSIFSNWSTSLLREMDRRGYFGKKSLTTTNRIELIRSFFSMVDSPERLYGMLRQSSYRSAPTTDRHALAAWAGCILRNAKAIKTPVKYKDGVVNLSFMQKVAKLSTNKESPLLIQNYLKKHGIILVIEPHFSKTYLDGAAILINKDNPVIGLTLRYDRPDNFWFTLMHELAHVALHYQQNIQLFYDELGDVKGLDIDTKEKEADDLAGEALVPGDKWEVSPARLVPSSMAANSLAKELGVHVAIVAGKIRHERGKYSYLNKIMKQEKVRQYFPEVNWTK